MSACYPSVQILSLQGLIGTALAQGIWLKGGEPVAQVAMAAPLAEVARVVGDHGSWHACSLWWTMPTIHLCSEDAERFGPCAPSSDRAGVYAREAN